MTEILYKYLDAEGAQKMLENHNLQFTNATRLNDPFDCHPSLIKFSNVPAERCRVWSKKVVSKLESSFYEKSRQDAWICSLSKVYDALLMWSYYGAHKGVCIGLDMNKVRKDLSHILNGVYIGVGELEVQYKDVIEKPDYSRNKGMLDFLCYQLSTKAKDWAHEKEVRLLLTSPMGCDIPYGFSRKVCKDDNSVDVQDVRFYPTIGKECFSALYLGVYIDRKDKEIMIEVARSCNPEMAIYQMTTDPEAFRLVPKRIENDEIP